MKSLSSKLKWKNIFAVQLWAFLFILINSDTYNFLDFLHICPKDKCHSTAYTIIFCFLLTCRASHNMEFEHNRFVFICCS